VFQAIDNLSPSFKPQNEITTYMEGEFHREINDADQDDITNIPKGI